MFKNDKLYFEAHSWVVHKADNWTEQDAENAIDALEVQILQSVDAAPANAANWVSLQIAGRSNATLEIVSGITWIHEVIPLMANVARGTNRRTAREAIANLLTATVTSAQQVFAYQPAYFGTITQSLEMESPVVYLASAGAERAT